MAIVMIVCALFAVGCNDVKANDENSYFVSIYKLQREQDEDGFIKEKGLSLWKTQRVIRSQGVELQGWETTYIYDTTTYCGEFYEFDKKGYFLPEADSTILATQREKKTIKFFVNGQELYNKLNNEEKLHYEENFVDMYDESLYFSNTMIGALKRVCNKSKITVIKFYANQYSDKAFVYKESSYSVSFSYFTLIKSTNVYITVA